jgi:pilus assembly protein CpaC
VNRAPRLVRTALFLVVALGVVALSTQAPPAPPQTPAASQESTLPRVLLVAGRSTVLTTDFDITRVAINNPAVADATVVEAREILIDGKAPGTVSLIVWGPTTRAQWDVVVDQGVSNLQRQLQTLFPGESIQANETADLVILNGHVSSNTVMLRAGELAEAMAPKSKVLNMLMVPGGSGSQQVELQVRVAEVNRSALRDLGVSLFTSATGYKNFIARSTTTQAPAPDFSGLAQNYDLDGNLLSATGSLTFSDFANLFVYNTKYGLGTLIKALETRGDLQSLAEPNLIAYNGQEASFLAGGQLPVPVVQGNTGAVSIVWKEFGVRLTFRPTIAGDVIRLKVAPEVSALDFGNGVSLGGFRIPAITTRRAETEVELQDGQSFAIAGLMNNTSQVTKQAIPLLSQLPIVGSLFKSKSNNASRTELLVLVTPHLVRPLNPDEVPPLPVAPGEFLKGCDKPPCAGAATEKPPGGRGGGS